MMLSKPSQASMVLSRPGNTVQEKLDASLVDTYVGYVELKDVPAWAKDMTAKVYNTSVDRVTAALRRYADTQMGQ